MLFFPKVKPRWGKIFLVSFLLLVVEMVIRNIEAVATMNFYLDPQYFSVWSKAMMPKEGPPPAEFFVLSAAFTLLSAMVLACVYECIKSSLEKDYWKRVLGFTKLMAGLTLVFAYLPMYLMINLPVALLISWFLTSVLITFIGAMMFVKILK